MISPLCSFPLCIMFIHRPKALKKVNFQPHHYTYKINSKTANITLGRKLGVRSSRYFLFRELRASQIVCIISFFPNNLLIFFAFSILVGALTPIEIWVEKRDTPKRELGVLFRLFFLRGGGGGERKWSWKILIEKYVALHRLIWFQMWLHLPTN